jgi:hypothetical protein
VKGQDPADQSVTSLILYNRARLVGWNIAVGNVYEVSGHGNLYLTSVTFRNAIQINEVQTDIPAETISQVQDKLFCLLCCCSSAIICCISALVN